jgi:hypothetical protein
MNDIALLDATAHAELVPSRSAFLIDFAQRGKVVDIVLVDGLQVSTPTHWGTTS